VFKFNIYPLITLPADVSELPFGQPDQIKLEPEKWRIFNTGLEFWSTTEKKRCVTLFLGVSVLKNF